MLTESVTCVAATRMQGNQRNIWICVQARTGEALVHIATAKSLTKGVCLMSTSVFLSLSKHTYLLAAKL